MFAKCRPDLAYCEGMQHERQTRPINGGEADTQFMIYVDTYLGQGIIADHIRGSCELIMIIIFPSA